MKKLMPLLCAGMTLCLSACAASPSSGNAETDVSAFEDVSREISPVGSMPEEETDQNPGTVISPYSLSELGYRLEIPEDIGIYDPNPYQTDEILVHPYFEPPLYYVQEEETTFQYGAYLFASYGGDNLVGVYTALHPQCMYTVAAADTSVCLSLLQAFLRADVEKEGARIAFLRTEKSLSGVMKYVPYTLSPEEVDAYKAYEDEEIVVYDFLALTSAPPLEEQLDEDAQGEILRQKGIDLSWISNMQEYFLETDGGIGRFLTKS